MRRVEISAFAEQDLAETFAFYEGRVAGLGRSLLQHFLRGIDAIQTLPAGYPVTEPPYRCYNLDRSPFGIIHDFDHAEIYIVAVKSHHRDPKSLERSNLILPDWN